MNNFEKLFGALEIGLEEFEDASIEHPPLPCGELPPNKANAIVTLGENKYNVTIETIEE